MMIRIAAAAAAVIALAAATSLRNDLYDSEMTLYGDTVAKSPDKARVRNNLGEVLRKAGRIEDARAHLERALELAPDYPDALNNLATVYMAYRRFDRATELLLRTLELRPEHLDARFNLAMVLYERGMRQEAAMHFEQVLLKDPKGKNAAFSAGMLRLMLQGGRTGSPTSGPARR